MLKSVLKNIRDKLTYLFLGLFGDGFTDKKFPAKLLFKIALFQKVLGFNREVYWPVHWSSQIKAPSNIDRGNRCPGLSRFCYLDGRNGIKFGKNVWVGPRVSIISMNHESTNYVKYIEEGPIIIGDNCWFGTGSIVLPNVTLGNHVIVAAGAIVTKSFHQDNIVIAGNPAKIIKQLDEYKKIEGDKSNIDA